MKRTFVMGLCALLALPVMAGERLSNEALKALYTGKTLTTVHFKLGPGKTYFAADGSVRSVRESGNERVGKWWIDEAANMRCVRWDGDGKDLCHYTEKNEDGTHTLVRSKDGKRLVEILSVAEGDQL